MTVADLSRENEELRQQLREAEELIMAVRTGAVDALAIQSSDGPRIFTLENADQGYRALIEQMNEGALLLSPEGTVLYANAALARLLGQPLASVLGSDFQASVPTDFRGYWQDLVLAGWASRQARGEMPLQDKAGVLRPYALSMNVLGFDGTPALAVLVTDLSARREVRAIQALVAEQNALLDRTSQELARQQQARHAVEQAAAEASRILEGIPQIAWTATPAGKNTYLNRRWYDFVGQAATSSPAQLLSHLHPDDVAPATAAWEHCIRTEAPLELECRLRDARGHYRWMLGRALPSRNEQGEIVQWIGTYTDIDEHKLAQERIGHTQKELRDNNQRLLRANADLDNFIYTASHDLKAPISNIEGLLQALLLELPATAAEGEEVAIIMALMQNSVHRFQKTIEHLTEVSRLQQEYGQPAPPVAVLPLVRDVLLDLDPLMQASAATVTVEVPDEAALDFSEKNLRSIIFNLVSNALKYHHPARPARVRLCLHRPDGTGPVLRVSDNGLGLTTAQQKKLFGMFQRLHDHVEGSGIGLYMVKKMVENAGGRISVVSEAGTGSEFSVYFAQ